LSLASHTLAFDDAPFEHDWRGDVGLIGVAFAGLRLDGVLAGRVRRDGANATHSIRDLVAGSKFFSQTRLVLLQGIAYAGFNVVDIQALHASLERPVLVVARREPDLVAIRGVLLDRIQGGRRKWDLIQRAGPMEAVSGLWVQRAGLELSEAGRAIAALAVHGNVPEPLRVAHLLAGALARGQSRGRV
jgi:uncharacterized protein